MCLTGYFNLTNINLLRRHYFVRYTAKTSELLFLGSLFQFSNASIKEVGLLFSLGYLLGVIIVVSLLKKLIFLLFI